jgi:hypothetical protein
MGAFTTWSASMSITKAEADRLIESFKNVSGYIASAFDFNNPQAKTTCDNLDKLYETMLSMVNVGGSTDAYLWGNVVTELQRAIARRHLHGKG